MFWNKNIGNFTKNARTSAEKKTKNTDIKKILAYIKILILGIKIKHLLCGYLCLKDASLYHLTLENGSKELNAWRQCTSRMVYFCPAHKNLICIYTKCILVSTQCTSNLSTKSPCINKESQFYLLGGPASCSRWRIPSGVRKVFTRLGTRVAGNSSSRARSWPSK